MKKSRLLAPALALTIFSTAAAVTGTVAWYFAQRSVSVKTTVTSFNPEAGLKVTLTEGVGTNIGTASSTNTNAPATVAHELIRDGSVDLANEKAYGAIKNRKGDQIIEFKEIDAKNNEDELLAGTNAQDKEYYYATKYSAKFELTQKNSGTQYALFYDNSLLGKGSQSSLIQESLRIGIVLENDYFVIAPFRSAAPADGLKYVVNTDPAEDRAVYGDKVIYGFETTITESGNPATYSITTGTTKAENLVDESNQPLDGTIPEARLTLTKGYMGKIKNAEEINVTVYTWFEGEDPHSDSKYVDDKAIETTLGFTLLEVEA